MRQSRVRVYHEGTDVRPTAAIETTLIYNFKIDSYIFFDGFRVLSLVLGTNIV